MYRVEIFCSVLSDVPHSIDLLEVSQAAPACPSDGSFTNEISMSDWCSHTDKENPEVRGGRLASLPPCVQQILHGLTLDRTRLSTARVLD